VSGPGNLERQRQVWESFVRGGSEWTDVLHPEVVYHDAPEFPDATAHHGKAAYLEVQRATEELADDIRYEVTELLDLGDRILTVMRLEAVTRGLPTAMDMVWLTRWSEGSIVEVRSFLSRERALEAAGAAG
jgi:ketosteroid isomerase-like protein